MLFVPYKRAEKNGWYEPATGIRPYPACCIFTDAWQDPLIALTNEEADEKAEAYIDPRRGAKGSANVICLHALGSLGYPEGGMIDSGLF